MKKLFSLFILFLVLSSAFSAVYNSNVLAMTLEEKEGRENIGYEKETSSGGYVLYFNGNAIKERIIQSDGYMEIENGVETIYATDEEGRIISEERNGEIRRYYYSESGILLSSILSNGDEIIDSSFYYYDTDGNIVRIDKNGISYIFKDNALFLGEGEEVLYIRDGIGILDIENTERVESEDGRLSVIESDGVRRTYSNRGLLLLEEGEGYRTAYTYDDAGRMLEERIERGDVLRINEYRSSRLYRSTNYNNETLRSIITYSDPVTEIRYRNGREYAELIYDSDGRTLREINLL